MWFVSFSLEMEETLSIIRLRAMTIFKWKSDGWIMKTHGDFIEEGGFQSNFFCDGLKFGLNIDG